LSRPARVFKASAAALPGSPWLGPTMQFLPFPMAGVEAMDLHSQQISPLNNDARRILDYNALWKSGMTGKGSIVGLIDSGIDPNHPDFQGRIIDYIDLTGEGQKDTFGHGTHVAGSIGGSGAASKGLYKGAAPDTRFVVFKVFDKDGNASEDTILAAMKKAAALPPEKRPQVLNMSLGGPGDPVTDPLSQMANHLMLKDNILVVAAAGNSGPGNGTLGAPGNAQYILTVTGVNKSGQFPFFSSRGPVQSSDGDIYNKPDLATIAGDVNLKETKTLDRISLMAPQGTGGKNPKDETGNHCVYAPGGVISDRSSDDPDTQCTVPGMPGYRYMSGTSMATPMATGVAADVIGYLRQKGVDYSATDVKAVLMETAKDLKAPAETQGAGLLNGSQLVTAVMARVQAGVPVGNIAYMLSVRLTSDQRKALAAQTRFKMTPLGILDTKNGRLIKTDKELFWLMKELHGPISVAFDKRSPARKPDNA
jgi:subtilisin family serine protease